MAEILDTREESQRRAYEEAFYAAFVKVTSNTLIRTLWQWNDAEQRLGTTIAYDDQIIYVERDTEGDINTAVGVNVTQRDFQSKAFGFAPEAGEKKWAEILTFFAREKSLSQRRSLISFILQDLAKRGFTTCYATTAARPLKAYSRYFGARLISTKEINGEKRFFLRYDLSAQTPPET